MKIPDANIKVRYQVWHGVIVVSDFINNGQNKLNAIALLYSDKAAALEKINLNTQNHLALIDLSLKNLKLEIELQTQKTTVPVHTSF